MAEITKEELQSTIEEAINRVLNSILVPSDYVSRAEVCKRLKFSLPTLDKLTNEGVITGKLIIGGNVRYLWSEVEQSIERFKNNNQVA